jgi:GWxTD domain-containing protein
MRKFLLVLGLMLLIGANISYAQKKLGFEFDFSRFKLDENSVYLELYYDIRDGDFLLVKADNGFNIKGNLHIEITNKVTKQPFYNKDFPFEEKFAQITEEIKAKNTLGVLGISIPKGEYLLKVNVHDSNDKTNSKEITENLVIAPVDEKTAGVSDVQLASNIIKEDADKSSIFYKSGMEVIPNPAMLYTNAMPIIHYYCEIYNVGDAAKTYKLVKSLFNSAGKRIVTSSRIVSAKGSILPDIGNINMSKYPTDNYNLEIALVDTVTKKAVVTAKRFYFYNANIAKVDISTQKGDFIGSEYAIMPESDCDKMLDQIKYIAELDELKQIPKLDTYEGKKKFLFTFWTSRNENNEKGINASRQEFEKRLEYATKNFSNQYREGYKTDRGRVVIKYGIPDDIERHPVEMNTEAYETWTYNNVDQEPNITFVFGDISGFGNYILLHSTKKDEPYNQYWVERLQKR